MTTEDILRQVAFPCVRFAGFAAHALLFGSLANLLLVLRPTFTELPLEEWANGRARLARRLEGFVQASLIAAGMAALLTLLLQALIVSELRRSDIGFSELTAVLDSNFGVWHAARFPLIGALAIVLSGRVRKVAVSLERAPGPVFWVTWGVLSFALLMTSSLAGHAAVSKPRLLAIANDAIHLGAGAIWFAGIIVLAVVLPDSWKGGDARHRLAILAPAVSRFSIVALYAIAVVAVTGTLNSFFNLARFGDLFSSGYGNALVVKLALFAVILAMGGINHFFLRERMRKARDEGTDAQAAFRKTIAVELAVALGVMAITAVLVGLPRTRKEIPPPTASVISERVR